MAAGTILDAQRFFRVHAMVSFNSFPGTIVAEEDALLESMK